MYIYIYQLYGGKCCLDFPFFYPENGNSKFFRMFGENLSNYMASPAGGQ